MSTVDDSELTEWWRDKIGRKVIFRYLHGEEEEGVVSSVGSANVFVRFGNNTTGEACDPVMLRLSIPSDGGEGGRADDNG